MLLLELFLGVGGFGFEVCADGGGGFGCCLGREEGGVRLAWRGPGRGKDGAGHTGFVDVVEEVRMLLFNPCFALGGGGAEFAVLRCELQLDGGRGVGWVGMVGQAERFYFRWEGTYWKRVSWSCRWNVKVEWEWSGEREKEEVEE